MTTSTCSHSRSGSGSRSRSLQRRELGLVLALAAGSLACPGTDDGGEDTETSAGAELGTVFRLELDASSLCGAQTEQLEFATRKRGCWDPELPCTSPTKPPWITGTTATCASLGGESTTWTVVIEKTGQYETQLRALASGGMQEGVHCYAAGTDNLTQVSNEDLELDRLFVMVEVSDDNCTNP